MKPLAAPGPVDESAAESRVITIEVSYDTSALNLALAPEVSEPDDPAADALAQTPPVSSPPREVSMRVSAPLNGTLLGERYRVERPLARGGMGRVYLARHERLDKAVAVKVLLRPENEEARLRFQREARLTCRVRHPHVVTAEDFGELPSGEPYLVLEYQDGPTLAAVLAREGALPPSRALPIIHQIIDGLEAIHRAGIIHRDLKPSNVFLLSPSAGQDFARIGDFGLARSARPGTAGEKLTQPGAVLGTPAYMAPEQILGEEATEATDQYALGILCYELLSGALPFTARDAGRLLIQQVTQAPPPLRARAPQVSEALAAVVERLLAKAPEARFESLPALRRALHRG